MHARQRRIESSLVNARAFLDEHPDELGVLSDAPARRQLDDAVQRVRVHAGAQDAAMLARSVNRETSWRAASDLVRGYMMPLAAFARAGLAGVPEFAALTKSVEPNPTRVVVAAARAMAAAAAPLVPQLTAAKFPADVVEQLSAAADQLEAAIRTSAATRADRIAATSGLASALQDGRDAVRMLDPVVTRLLHGNPLLAAWNSVKRVRSAPAPAAPAPATPTNTATVANPEVKAA